jgi:hypothetical protein
MRGEGILEKLRKRREAKREGELPEIKRENNQIKKLAKVRKMESKGKTETNRYKKLKDEVYNPFPDNPSKRKDAISKFRQGYTDKNKGDLTEYNKEKREFHWNKKAKK